MGQLDLKSFAYKKHIKGMKSRSENAPPPEAPSIGISQICRVRSKGSTNIKKKTSFEGSCSCSYDRNSDNLPEGERIVKETLIKVTK